MDAARRRAARQFGKINGAVKRTGPAQRKRVSISAPTVRPITTVMMIIALTESVMFAAPFLNIFISLPFRKYTNGSHTALTEK